MALSRREKDLLARLIGAQVASGNLQDPLQVTKESEEQAGERRKKKKREAAARAEWAGLPSRWDAVDTESDKKFFNLVEGAAEENRLNQRTEAELIAHRDWKNVELVDPLTKLPINNLKEILQDYNVSLDQIYI